MSLIVLSNQANEEDIVGEDNSIFKPYNFRNALASTMKIPKNAQISLQSAKINLDGSIVLGAGDKFFYLYIGQGIKGVDNTFNRLDDIHHSTGYPIKVKLYEHSKDTSVKVNPYELGKELEKALNRYVYNPQYTNTIEVEQTLSATNVFDGFKIKFPGALTPNSGAPGFLLYKSVPGTDTAVDGSYDSVRRGTAAAGWTYGAPPGVGIGTFNVATIKARTQHVTFNVPPIARKRGICKFNITDAYVHGGADRQQCNFAVGLSRSVNTTQIRGIVGGTNQLNPPYYQPNNGTGYITWMKSYLDFGVVVNHQRRVGYNAGDIMLVQSVVDSSDVLGPVGTRHLTNLPKLKQLDYTTCPQSHFYQADRFNVWADTLDDGFKLHSIEFRVDGEAMSVILLSAGAAGDGSDGTEYTLIEYDSTQDAEHNLKPISQDCWSLYPHMLINNFTTDVADQSKSIVIDDYTSTYINFDETAMGVGDTWALYDSVDGYVGLATNNGILAGGWRIPGDKGGYYSWEAEMVIKGEKGAILDIMNRPFIDRGNAIFTAGAPNPIEYDNLQELGADPEKTVWKYNKPVLILQESDRYQPSQGANFKRLLGFENTPVVDFFDFGAGADDLNLLVSSTSPPRLVSSKSIFVRIGNFTQESMNAFKGNVSKIIAHLPRFDGTNISGPLYLEPNNMVYLDLNNSEELNVNSFDVSLCYQDESYADALVGTTIIVLHVRQKGDPTN